MSHEIITTGSDNVLMYSLLTRLLDHYEENPDIQLDILDTYKNTNKYGDFFNRLLVDFKGIQDKVLFSKSSEVFNMPRNYSLPERHLAINTSEKVKEILNPLSYLKTIEEYKINEKGLEK